MIVDLTSALPVFVLIVLYGFDISIKFGIACFWNIEFSVVFGIVFYKTELSYATQAILKCIMSLPRLGFFYSSLPAIVVLAVAQCQPVA